ncbi:MAG: hypothetical protein HYV26_01220 [Candidatus Hydrogenedentes bacterium]|nr:hypothetical protein [Candidatus Hydrogenedentota bacterium]
MPRCVNSFDGCCMVASGTETGRYGKSQSFSTHFVYNRPFKLPYVFWGANFFPEDWNRDGDVDLLIRSEFYLFWAEKSFLRHGYREAMGLGAAEQRPHRGFR